jgi:hypothetical protein
MALSCKYGGFLVLTREHDHITTTNIFRVGIDWRGIAFTALEFYLFMCVLQRRMAMFGAATQVSTQERFPGLYGVPDEESRCFAVSLSNMQTLTLEHLGPLCYLVPSIVRVTPVPI